MTESRRLDPLDGLVAARDAVRKLQELAAKIALPAEHRAALTDGIARLVMPGEQLQALIDLAEAFGPPQTQLAEIQRTLTDQRIQLETMLSDLDRVESIVSRLAAASEQLVALQRPFMAALQRFGDPAPADPTDPEPTGAS